MNLHLFIVIMNSHSCIILDIFLEVFDIQNKVPITNDQMTDNKDIAIVAVKADPLLSTAQALAVVGPRVFGYKFDYKPFMDTRL